MFLFFSCEYVKVCPSGTNIGSNPHLLPCIFLDIFPRTSAPNNTTSPSFSQYAIIDLNVALLCFDNNLRIPSFPIVSNAKDEYGPGKPFSDEINNPSSSIIIGFEQNENACLALCVVLLLRDYLFVFPEGYT